MTIMSSMGVLRYRNCVITLAWVFRSGKQIGIPATRGSSILNGDRDERWCSRQGWYLGSLSGLHLSEGQDETKCCTYAYSAFDTDVPFMGIDHIFNDLGAESCSTGFSADGTSGEEAVTNFRRHATPCIRHRNVENVGRLRHFSVDCDG